MKAFYYIIAAILIVAPWVGNAQMNTNSLLPACTYANRATCAPVKDGTRIRVYDCATTACTGGGGSIERIFEYNGTDWSALVSSNGITLLSPTQPNTGSVSDIILRAEDHGSKTIFEIANDSNTTVIIAPNDGTDPSHISIRGTGTNSTVILGDESISGHTNNLRGNTDLCDRGPCDVFFGTNAATATFTPPSHTDFPTSCTLGMMLFETDTQTLWVCTNAGTPGTWDDLAFVP